MPALLIIFPLLISTAMSQDMLNSILFQVSDVEDAGMIFAGSVAAKVRLNLFIISIRPRLKDGFNYILEGALLPGSGFEPTSSRDINKKCG